MVFSPLLEGMKSTVFNGNCSSLFVDGCCGDVVPLPTCGFSLVGMLPPCCEVVIYQCQTVFENLAAQAASRFSRVAGRAVRWFRIRSRAAWHQGQPTSGQVACGNIAIRRVTLVSKGENKAARNRPCERSTTAMPGLATVGHTHWCPAPAWSARSSFA